MLQEPFDKSSHNSVITGLSKLSVQVVETCLSAKIVMTAKTDANRFISQNYSDTDDSSDNKNRQDTESASLASFRISVTVRHPASPKRGRFETIGLKRQ